MPTTMRLSMVDCRSLIQFCRSFPSRQQQFHQSEQAPPFRSRFPKPISNQFCHRTPLFAVDLAILVSVITSSAFLTLPDLKFFFCELLPTVHGTIVDHILEEPLPYVVGFPTVVVGVILALFIDARLRKCENPNCKGLRRAVEYDIQLETEACVKHSPPLLLADAHRDMLELGEDRKEFEAELKKMVPVNGSTMLNAKAIN